MKALCRLSQLHTPEKPGGRSHFISVGRSEYSWHASGERMLESEGMWGIYQRAHARSGKGGSFNHVLV